MGDHTTPVLDDRIFALYQAGFISRAQYLEYLGLDLEVEEVVRTRYDVLMNSEGWPVYEGLEGDCMKNNDVKSMPAIMSRAVKNSLKLDQASTLLHEVIVTSNPKDVAEGVKAAEALLWVERAHAELRRTWVKEMRQHMKDHPEDPMLLAYGALCEALERLIEAPTAPDP